MQTGGWNNQNYEGLFGTQDKENNSSDALLVLLAGDAFCMATDYQDDTKRWHNCI